MMLISAPIRGQDKHGAGHFGAPRGGRTHNGIDIACYAGSVVYAASAGTVTKIGYPYDPNEPKKGHLRYVQVSDGEGIDCRYFYVQPAVQVGDKVRAGEAVGKTQGLLEVYPGITDHFHFEVRHENGDYLDPVQYLEEA